MAAIGTRNMKIEVDGTAHTPSVSNARFTVGDADADFLSFEQAAEGGAKEWRFNATAVQDAAAGSLWRELWDSVGTEVVVTLMPYGNAVPSVTEPHFEATVTIEENDGDVLGGEANASKSARMTVDISWPCDAKPTMVTA